ncbi:hypothetical protein ACEPAI_7176 [Sanghuangporus weigelae]
MFKRVTKKQKKREQEEELGLDDDTRQMFGLQDTDSDESSSQSNSESDDELDRGEAEADIRTEWLAAEGSSSEDENDSDEEGLDLESIDDDPPISLAEAVKNPIYHISSEKLNDERACITCPKKLLKNEKMVELHLSSAAHVRRFKKFCELAKRPDNRSEDPRRISAAISKNPTAVTSAEGLSKRGLKRKQKLETIKRKRETTKHIIERKKRKHAKKEVEAETGTGKKAQSAGKKRESDVGTSKSKPSISRSDKQASERPRKRRKVLDSDGHEATRENADDDHGGDSTRTGEQTEMMVGATAESKPPKMKTKVIKVKDKSKSIAKAKTSPGSENSGNHAEAQATDSTSTRRQKDRTKTVRFFEDDGAIDDNSEDARTTKKRDLRRLKTKGRIGREGAGKFAKLSNTRPAKDKSQRKSQTQGVTARNSFLPKKSARYFDEPEDGTSVGPKKSSMKKQLKKTKSEAKGLKRNNSAKGDGEDRLQKAESKWREKAGDDLVIFD